MTLDVFWDIMSWKVLFSFLSVSLSFSSSWIFLSLSKLFLLASCTALLSVSILFEATLFSSLISSSLLWLVDLLIDAFFNVSFSLVKLTLIRFKSLDSLSLIRFKSLTSFSWVSLSFNFSFIWFSSWVFNLFFNNSISPIESFRLAVSTVSSSISFSAFSISVVTSSPLPAPVICVTIVNDSVVCDLSGVDSVPVLRLQSKHVYSSSFSFPLVAHWLCSFSLQSLQDLNWSASTISLIHILHISNMLSVVIVFFSADSIWWLCCRVICCLIPGLFFVLNLQMLHWNILSQPGSFTSLYSIDFSWLSLMCFLMSCTSLKILLHCLQVYPFILFVALSWIFSNPSSPSMAAVVLFDISIFCNCFILSSRLIGINSAFKFGLFVKTSFTNSTISSAKTLAGLFDWIWMEHLVVNILILNLFSCPFWFITASPMYSTSTSPTSSESAVTTLTALISFIFGFNFAISTKPSRFIYSNGAASKSIEALPS